MESAKTIAKIFVTHQPITVQIGVVAFSESGFSVQPPHQRPSRRSGSINPSTPQRGTFACQRHPGCGWNTIAKQLGDAPLEAAILPGLLPTPTPVPEGTIPVSRDRIAQRCGKLMLTPDPLSAAQTAADRGVGIHTVAWAAAPGRL